MPDRTLSQIIAVEKGTRQTAYSRFTELHRLASTKPLLAGVIRTYQPRDEDGDRFPREETRVQVTASDVIQQVGDTLTRLFDVAATREYGNTHAHADVVVDGAVLLTAVPVGYLLFLEKQLVDLRTFVTSLPVLDAAEQWTPNGTAGVWRTQPTETAKTKKLLRNHVRWVPPTPEYTQPAQVETFGEDVVVGTWTTTWFSGALPAARVTEILSRLDALTQAVKYAREQANSTLVAEKNVGRVVFDHLFA